MNATTFDLKILRVPAKAFYRALSKFQGCQTQEFEFLGVPITIFIIAIKFFIILLNVKRETKGLTG